MKIRFHAIALAICLAGNPLNAAWQDDIGFTRLQSIAGAELPSAPSQGLTHVEGSESPPALSYAPDTASPLFTGKSFTFKSGASTTSGHAQHVATNFYGSTSLIPGATGVDLYDADDWIGPGFLNLSDTIEPEIETRAVQNHSWTGTTGVYDTEADQRLDYAIDRDGFVCAIGENNGNTTILPLLLSHCYHTIAVGRRDGGHSAGFTTFDGVGRIKPDIVAPNPSPESFTSFTTAMVSSTAGLLYAKLAAAPYSLTGADKPRVIKALLLASATKDNVASWSNTTSRPLDLRYGAGCLNANHAYSTLRAGKAVASNTTQYNLRGWAAESVAGTSSKTYFFTIPAGAPSTPFCAAMTWHRSITDGDPGPDWGSLVATLADLNLHLHHASGFTLGSLVTESLSTVDNVELVYQPTLAPGDYAIVVENTSAAATAYGLAWHSLPAVTVAATTSTAREIDGQAGVITLTRTGDTTLPLYVPLTIGGTAIAGTHYAALPSNITIPAGQVSYNLAVTPVSDYLAQGNRTVTVAVAADFALVRDTAQSSVVTIQDKPFDNWRFANFTTPELANPAISSETADPDADRLANLIEYALNLPPKTPSGSTASLIDISGHLALSANKNTAATDVTWGAEVTGSMSSWNPAVTVTDTSTTFEARDSVLKSAADKRFIRLKITRP